MELEKSKVKKALSYRWAVFGILALAYFLLIGIGVAMVYIPTMKFLAAWYRKNEFASLSGILLAVGNLGALSAAAPLALMSDALGWQQVFIILGVITLVLAVLAWIIIRDRPSDINLPSIQEIEAEETGEPVPEAKTMENIPMCKALKMIFGAGMKFWPLAI